ncbi:YlbE-like family protein [Bacillus sp. 2205SS5-2]|uniref:YlbE-like family protein n=1 Tax=Bacillus sp. 2205SS5-2 TaxID=3109031 RepID=UPI0030053A5E
MRKDVLEVIYSSGDLKNYLREQPNWYRKLTRNPEEINLFQVSAIQYYKKTIPHQVEKFSNGVQMASMMMGMFQAMNTPGE